MLNILYPGVFCVLYLITHVFNAVLLLVSVTQVYGCVGQDNTTLSCSLGCCPLEFGQLYECCNITQTMYVYVLIAVFMAGPIIVGAVKIKRAFCSRKQTNQPNSDRSEVPVSTMGDIVTRGRSMFLFYRCVHSGFDDSNFRHKDAQY